MDIEYINTIPEKEILLPQEYSRVRTQLLKLMTEKVMINRSTASSIFQAFELLMARSDEVFSKHSTKEAIGESK